MFAIGEASVQSGVKTETIRFYERSGILPKPERSPRGQRMYREEDIIRLAFIRRCRDHGFSLPQAKELLSLSTGETVPCSMIKSMTEANLVEVNRKIAELQNLARMLTGLTVQCGDGQEACPITETMFGK